VLTERTEASEPLGMRRSLLGLGFGVAVALASVPPAAIADDATESRFLDQLARREYAARRWDRALDAFLAAYRATPNARLLYNVALCAELSRRPSMAFAYYDEYLASSDTDAARRADATARRARLAGSLALVRVTSDPPGAAIYADRRDLGVLGETPRTIALTPGEHRILLAREGHEDASVAVSPAAGREIEIATTLTPITTELALEVVPADASISAVGPRGEVSLVGGTTLVPVGAYSITARAPGHRETTVELVLRPGVAERRTLVLDALPPPSGRLLVSLATAGVSARVRIDGAEVAETPARLDLGVGAHTVELAAEGFLPWSGTVRIEEGRGERLTVDLVPAR
jgi:hypothetical protein